MPSRATNVLSFGLLGLILIGGVAVVLSLWLQRGPLTGDVRHDFGMVPIDGDAASVRHVFRLTNRSSDPVVVLRAIPSCGCTTVEPVKNIVEAGGVVEIPATLRLTATGPKQAHIDLLLDQEGRELTKTLFVKGVGLRTNRLRSELGRMQITPGVLNSHRILLEVLEDDREPPAPRFTVPDSCEVSFTGWTLRQTRKPSKTRPAVWDGRVLVRLREGEPIPAGEMLEIAVPPDQRLSIELLDRPFYESGDGSGRHSLPLPGVTPPPPTREDDAPGSPADSAPDGR